MSKSGMFKLSPLIFVDGGLFLVASAVLASQLTTIERPKPIGVLRPLCQCDEISCRIRLFGMINVAPTNFFFAGQSGNGSNNLSPAVLDNR